MSGPAGKPSDGWAQVAMYSSLGFVLAGSIAGGYALGWLLDRWLGTTPILALVFGFVGVAGGLIEILRILERWEKRAGRNDSSNGPGAS